MCYSIKPLPLKRDFENRNELYHGLQSVNLYFPLKFDKFVKINKDFKHSRTKVRDTHLAH